MRGHFSTASDERRAAPARSVRQGASAVGDADEAVIRRFKAILLDEIDLGELSRMDASQRRVRLERVMAHLVSREGLILSSRQRNQLVRRVVDEAVGLGVLEPLLADDTISEIMINGHHELYVERFGTLQRIPSAFSSEEQLVQTIDRIVSTVNRRVDESNPMVDARLPPDARMPRGARVHVVLPPLALNGPVVTIRLFPKAYGLGELLARGTLDATTAELLRRCVRARLNVIVSGGTASGKTTMLNALSAFIPEHERIITIEDAAELSLEQEHVIRLETRPANVEGTGAVPIRELLRNSLRMRPDRIVVGECRGGEALDMLQAMNTGHEGSLTTVHANTAGDALTRLQTLASMSDVEIPFPALHEQVNQAVDVIVQLQRGSDGTRRVVSCDYVASEYDEPFRLRSLMRWEPASAENASGSGRFVVGAALPRLRDRLAAAGERLPDGIPVEERR